MPIYEYQCGDCGGRDRRLVGIDDHTALCTQCAGLMLRLDLEVFQPYFKETAKHSIFKINFSANPASANNAYDLHGFSGRLQVCKIDRKTPDPGVGPGDT